MRAGDGGEGGIRTLGCLSTTSDFESVVLSRRISLIISDLVWLEAGVARHIDVPRFQVLAVLAVE